MKDASAAPEQPEGSRGELVGDEVDGRFRVVEQIGGGGMGSIFRVEHVELGRQFAMKVLKTELSKDRAMVERFRREARVAASISSEHVVAIVDSGVLPDRRPYFVMDLLLGSDLRRLLLAHGSLAPARVANLGIDVCRGLSAAHGVGLIHRDLKPENLFVTRGDDGRDICKILDFGVAKCSDTGTTRPGMLVGTVRYMAPEQIGLDAPVGPRTDLHALGVILYECLCGVPPFEGDTTERVLYGIMNGAPVPLRERRPELSAELASVITRAFAREPNARYPSALALAEALLPFAAGRQASPTEAWWVDVSANRGAANGRQLTPVLESTPGKARPPELPSARAGARFPWRVAGISLLGGAAAVGVALSAFHAPAARTTGVPQPRPSPNQPVAVTARPPRPEAPAGAASVTPAAGEAAVTTPSASRPAPPPAVRGPRALPASPRLPPNPSFDSQNPRLPPNPSFDSQNPYAN